MKHVATEACITSFILFPHNNNNKDNNHEFMSVYVYACVDVDVFFFSFNLWADFKDFDKFVEYVMNVSEKSHRLVHSRSPKIIRPSRSEASKNDVEEAM